MNGSNGVDENSIYCFNTNDMMNDPYGVDPYSLPSDPYQQPSVSSMGMEEQRPPKQRSPPMEYQQPMTSMAESNPYEMTYDQPYDTMQYNQQYDNQPMQHVSPPSTDQPSQQQPPQYSSPPPREFQQQQMEMEDNPDRYYCEIKPLHGLPHPLELLRNRRPGIDHRNELFIGVDKQDIYTNVIHINELTQNVDERRIAQLFTHMCPYKKIFVSNPKKYAFVTLFTRQDAMAVFRHLFRLSFSDQPKDFGFSVVWGRDVWMKKEDPFDNKIGKCSTTMENIPTHVIVNFDKTYVYYDDVKRIYGVEPQKAEIMPSISPGLYQPMNSYQQPLPNDQNQPMNDYHQGYMDQPMGYNPNGMSYMDQNQVPMDPRWSYQNHPSPPRDSNQYRSMNRNNRPR